MLKTQKKSSRKFTRARDGITRTPLRDATAAQLQQLFKTVYIKYVVTLEDQLQEDKAHLFLKEKTIGILQSDVKQKNSKLRDYEKYQKLNVNKVNKNWDEREQKFNALEWILRDKIEKLENGAYVKKYIEAYENCLKKNDEFVIQNGELIKERDEVTRAYNGLHQMGKFAEELNIDIKKYSKKLPENNMEFEQNHKVLESGKVQHSYKFTMPQKEKKNN
jgi:hypothetical protein